MIEFVSQAHNFHITKTNDITTCFLLTARNEKWEGVFLSSTLEQLEYIGTGESKQVYGLIASSRSMRPASAQMYHQDVNEYVLRDVRSHRVPVEEIYFNLMEFERIEDDPRFDQFTSRIPHSSYILLKEACKALYDFRSLNNYLLYEDIPADLLVRDNE